MVVFRKYCQLLGIYLANLELQPHTNRTSWGLPLLLYSYYGTKCLRGFVKAPYRNSGITSSLQWSAEVSKQNIYCYDVLTHYMSYKNWIAGFKKQNILVLNTLVHSELGTTLITPSELC